MLAGEGRGIPLTSCWRFPPPRSPSSPHASSLQSSAAPSAPGSSGCVFPPSPPPQTPLWNDVAPPASQSPPSRPLTRPSWSTAGGSHPRASPDVYGVPGLLFSLFPPLCSGVHFSFHQIQRLTERKNTDDCLPTVLNLSTLNRLPGEPSLMKDSTPAGSVALCTDYCTLRGVTMLKRPPFILVRNFNLGN